jgi:hypothetical protein
MDNGNVLLRMSNGEAYECPLDIDTFEEILEDSERVIDLSEISQN